MSKDKDGCCHKNIKLIFCAFILDRFCYTSTYFPQKIKDSAGMLIQKKIVPPIKYPGGKRFLVDHIAVLWKLSEQKRLVEPFSGGMAISLGIAPKNALINDINSHVINFYRSIQEGLKIRIKMVNDEKYYYSARERFNKLIMDGEQNTHLAASLFYYLNKTGYNGLIRFNKSGYLNVPFGRYKKINYKREFEEIRNVIKGWNLSSGDFSKLRIRKTDFIYLDPPYDVEFTTYSGNTFGWEEQERLVRHFEKYSCPIVISNQATTRVVKLYKENGYTVHLIDAPRMISCNGDRTRAQEVLAVKNMKTPKGY